MSISHSRSYWNTGRPRSQILRFDRMIIIGLFVIGGAVTFSNDSKSDADGLAASTPKSGSMQSEQGERSKISASGGHVSISTAAFNPNAVTVSAYEDETHLAEVGEFSRNAARNN